MYILLLRIVIAIKLYLNFDMIIYYFSSLLLNKNFAVKILIKIVSHILLFKIIVMLELNYRWQDI